MGIDKNVNLGLGMSRITVRPPHPPSRFPRPVKHPRYPVTRPEGKPQSVTVCIAAISQLNNNPKIVLCSDTKFDDSYMGFTEGNAKMGRIGHGWVGMISGTDVMSAKDLHAHIKSEMLADAAPTSNARIVEILKNAGTAFMQTAMYSKDHRTDIIVAGFCGNRPCIASVSIDKTPRPNVSLYPAFCVIGSGGSIAHAFLSLRGCVPQQGVNTAMYIVYEAKKYSEVISSVGKETVLMMIEPLPADGKPHQLNNVIANSELIGKLEAARGSYGLQIIWDTPVAPVVGQFAETRS